MRGVLILLMIAFHLVYFSSLYPTAKSIVYVFHMPAFLVISGFLMNIGKTMLQFGRTLLFYFVPYCLFEATYILGAAHFPIAEHINQLTPGIFFSHLLLHPLGPYWYLQALVICGAVYYLVFRLVPLEKWLGRLPWSVFSQSATVLWLRIAVLALLYAVIVLTTGTISATSAFYFLFGAVMRQMRFDFQYYFFPHWLSIIFFAVFVANPSYRNPLTLGGMGIVFLSMSGMLYLFRAVPGKAAKYLAYIGRNTLLLLLFSPIFTLLCKALQNPLAFDTTGMLFLILSLLICVAGSLLMGWLSDVLHLSPYIFGKKQALSRL